MRHESFRLLVLCEGEFAGVGGDIRGTKRDRDVSLSNRSIISGHT